MEPQPLALVCHGPLYDDGVAASAGHFAADLGFEHYFTGHGGLLAPGAASNPFGSSDHPLEHTFRQWMSANGNLKEYHAKTAKTSNNCSIGWKPSKRRFRSSAAKWLPRERKILRRGWTPSSHGVNLNLRRAPKRHLIIKATSAEEFFRGGRATAKIVAVRLHRNGHLTQRSSEPSQMENPKDSDCFLKPANEPVAVPSLHLETGIKSQRVFAEVTGMLLLPL